MEDKIVWICKAFELLSPFELYGILQLRNSVFVVEQNCVYNDTDGKDLKAMHLFAMKEDKVIAHARLIPKGLSYNEASIGRVVTDIAYRNTGLGRQLMEKSIEETLKTFSTNSIRISAQAWLKGFYQSLGFVQQSNEYLEDDIPHIEMLYEKH